MKRTLKLFIHAQSSVINPGRWEFTAFSCDMSRYGYACLGEQEVEIDVPDHGEITRKMVEGLRSQLDAMRVKHYQEQSGLQESIDNLLAIEHKPESA